MNLIYKALQLLCNNRILTKELLINELSLEGIRAEVILAEIASMALGDSTVIRVECFNEGTKRYEIQIQLAKSLIAQETDDFMENYRQKFESRLFSPLKKKGF